jgi:hypothetical protein
MPEWHTLVHRWTYGDPETMADQEMGQTTLVLSPAGTAGGVVRDAKGNPLKEAMVSVMLEMDAARPESRRAIAVKNTDAEGRWEIPAVPRADAKITIFIRHRDCLTYSIRPVEADAETAKVLFSKQADIRLGPLIPVTGTVSANGKPVVGANVYLQGPLNVVQQTTTNGEGQFQVGAQEPGKQPLMVVAKGLAPKREAVEVQEETKPLSIVMDAGRPLTMRVVHGARIPIADVPVLLATVTGRQGPQNPQPPELYLPEKPVLGTTGEDGRFVWPHAPRAIVLGTLLLPSGRSHFFEWDARKDEEFVLKLDASEK